MARHPAACAPMQVDMTLANAAEVYADSKQAKTQCWGFKDVNISFDKAKALGNAMMQDGKEFFLESLVNNEEDAMKVAQFAIDIGANYLISMEYYPSVHALLKGTQVKFMPTCGRRAGHPRRMLYGTIEEIIADAKRVLSFGVDGICLSLFRYVDGDPLELASRFVKEVDAPLIISGSINSDERLDFIRKVNPWGFTIGSALFEDNFGAEKSVAEKLDYVTDYVNR